MIGKPSSAFSVSAVGAAGVNLPALVRLVAGCDDVPAIFSAYHAHVGPAPLDSLITGLSLLVARHALILEDAR